VVWKKSVLITLVWEKMILFNRDQSHNNLKRLTVALLREMYSISDASDIGEIKGYIKDLKKCLDSFLPFNEDNEENVVEFMEDRTIHHSSSIESNNISKADVD